MVSGLESEGESGPSGSSSPCVTGGLRVRSWGISFHTPEVGWFGARPQACGEDCRQHRRPAPALRTPTGVSCHFCHPRDELSC